MVTIDFFLPVELFGFLLFQLQYFDTALHAPVVDQYFRPTVYVIRVNSAVIVIPICFFGSSLFQ